MGLQDKSHDEVKHSLRADARQDSVDLGELARARDLVAALESSLESQSHAHADMIHLLCHELRTPVTVISGFHRLLLDPSNGGLTERQTRFVNESLKACRRLDLLVSDLLDASPGLGLPLAVRLERARLDDVIRSTSDALSPLLEDRRMDVELNLDPSIEDLDLDPGRIEQVMTNLLMNSIRYGQIGGVISVGRVETVEDGESVVRVYVEDDGPGIPEVDRKRIFEPYVRGASRATCSGLGVGLSICQRIIASHAGSIRVEDGSSGGARFVFTLPMTSSAAKE